jgi:plastocyanin
MWNIQKPTQRRLGVLLFGMGMAALTAAALPAVGASGEAVVSATAAAAHTATVEIANFKFAPPDLTVTAGTTVVWKNADDSPHRIADVGGGYASAALDTDDSFSHIFATPGVYNYICSIHPYMKGKIVVKPAGTGS